MCKVQVQRGYSQKTFFDFKCTIVSDIYEHVQMGQK